MGFEKLLYITNSVEADAGVIRHIAGLRKLGLLEVILCHPSDGDQWKEKLGAIGLGTKTLTVEDALIPGLLNAAHREGVSFISSRIDEQTKGWFPKAYPKALLQRSDVPVMAMPAIDGPVDTDGAGMFDHVILAADWSESCRKAMRYLLGFKGFIKALEIIHVVGKRLSIREMRELRQMLSAWRSAFLDHAIDAEFHIYAGKCNEEILLAAKDYGGTCIVMGRPKNSSIKEILKLSNTYRVAEASPVPTIIVP